MKRVVGKNIVAETVRFLLAYLTDSLPFLKLKKKKTEREREREVEV
jgi:hypothetical protein